MKPIQYPWAGTGEALLLSLFAAILLCIAPLLAVLNSAPGVTTWGNWALVLIVAFVTMPHGARMLWCTVLGWRPVGAWRMVRRSASGGLWMAEPWQMQDALAAAPRWMVRPYVRGLLAFYPDMVVDFLTLDPPSLARLARSDLVALLRHQDPEIRRRALLLLPQVSAGVV